MQKNHIQDGPTATKSTVKVTVEGIEKAQGSIQLAIFNKAEDFTDKPFKTARKAVEGQKSLEMQIEDVPFGTYAVAVYHDVNDNQKLDTGLFGIPKEPYGFSNNYMPSMSKPKFEDAKITIEQEEVTMRIKVE